MNLKASICLIFGLLAALPTPSTAMQQKRTTRWGKYALATAGGAMFLYGCLYLIAHKPHLLRLRPQAARADRDEPIATVRYNSITNTYLTNCLDSDFPEDHLWQKITDAIGVRYSHNMAFEHRFRVTDDGQIVEMTAKQIFAENPLFAGQIQLEQLRVNRCPYSAPDLIDFTFYPNFFGMRVYRPTTTQVLELREQAYRDFLRECATPTDRLKELVRRAHAARMAAQPAAPAQAAGAAAPADVH